jgi:hypothetical protein
MRHMVASGDRGFQSYRAYTSVADVVIRRYLEECAKIARDRLPVKLTEEDATQDRTAA